MALWLARHGETEWSRSGRHTGRTDLPLLPEGEAQARALGERLAGRPFARVLASPLGRALETARLAGFAGRVEVADLLTEVDYGEYEGRTGRDIRAERPGWELFRDGAPGGESPDDIAATADRIVAEAGRGDGDVLLFGHGHRLRSVAVRYLGLPVWVAGVLRLDAGSLSILGTEHDHVALILWNDRSIPGEPR